MALVLGVIGPAYAGGPLGPDSFGDNCTASLYEAGYTKTSSVPTGLGGGLSTTGTDFSSAQSTSVTATLSRGSYYVEAYLYTFLDSFGLYEVHPAIVWNGTGGSGSAGASTGAPPYTGYWGLDRQADGTYTINIAGTSHAGISLGGDPTSASLIARYSGPSNPCTQAYQSVHLSDLTLSGWTKVNATYYTNNPFVDNTGFTVYATHGS